ncbi:MAG TPA: SDR family oxidoreductase [Armatimonadota bacterium]
MRGKTALITGGAQRVGAAIALALAEQGVHIVIHYRHSAAEAEMLAREVRAAGVTARTLAGDLADPAVAEELVGHALALAGTLDLLVNNASEFPPDTLETMSLPSLEHNLAVNAWAPLALSRAFRREVGHGQIINLLDSRMDDYDPGHASYLLSKQLLAAITRTTAVEFAPQLAVNAVAPGLILPPAGRDAAYLEALGVTVPLQHAGDPGDVAAAVVFLAQSTFITGHTVYVDGGRHLKEYPANGPHSDQ